MAEPTRRAALLALAARVEQAAEGSRTLDEVISCAIFPELRAVNDGETIWIMHGQRVRILDYSSSLDAALSLVPEGMFVKMATMWQGIVGGSAWIFGPSGRSMSDIKEWGKSEAAVDRRTPLACALTAAALRARAAME